MPDERRLRLFVAFRLGAEVIDAIVAWQARALGRTEGLRRSGADQLHITVAFLGSQPLAAVDGVTQVVGRHVRDAPRPSFRVGRYHETSRVGMLVLHENPVLDDHWAGRANRLAGDVVFDLEAAGVYRGGHRAWKPHVTVARFRERPGLDPTPPELRCFDPLDVALYESRLSADGASYRPVTTFAFNDTR